MRIAVENGWRGPIEGVARMAAIVPRGAELAVLIARPALIRLPRIGDLIPHQDNQLRVEAVTATATEITLICRSITNG